MSQPRTFLAAIGSTQDPKTWSGIPYHFLQAGKAAGLIDEGLTLSCNDAAWQRRRMLWNGWRLITGRGKGGYQYSVPFLERYWQSVREKLLDQTIINCFQLYPPSMVKNPRYRKIFYIDMTLKQLFDEYGIRETIGSAIADEALALEKAGYQAAARIVSHSQWAADSVIADYQIDRKKVSAIVPGANIDRDTLLRWQEQAQLPSCQSDEKLKLVFVGKYWDRKGLDRLLAALQVVQLQNKQASLTVIGCRQEDLPESLRHTPHVEWIGFIDKKHELQKFMDTVASADIGCLLSRAEAGGMVLREFHVLGLMVMGTAVGGSPEHLFADAGKVFSPTSTAEEIAQWLVNLIDHPSELAALRHRAWSKRQLATWDETVRQWYAVLA